VVSRENVDTENVTLKARVSNLSDAPRVVTVKVLGQSQEVTLPANANQDVSFAVTLTDSYDSDGFAKIRMEVYGDQQLIDQTLVQIKRSLTLQDMLKRFKQIQTGSAAGNRPGLGI